MDCDALHSDIDRLRSLRDALEASLAQATETGHGKSSVLSAQSEASTATDQILEKYLPDFNKYNSDVNSEWSFGQSMAFTDISGSPVSICTSVSLPNGHVIFGGDRGTLCEYRKDSSGQWQVTRLDIFKNIGKIDPCPDYVLAAASASDDSIFVGGSGGTLSEYRKDSSGQWRQYPIGQFIDDDGSWTSVQTIYPFSDHNILVGGSSRTLREYYKDSSGRWVTKPIDGFKNIRGYNDDVTDISPTAKGSIFMGGWRGTLCECYKDPSGQWHFTQIDNSDGRIGSIDGIAPLPDGNMLVGEKFGLLGEYYKDSSGQWQYLPIDDLTDISGIRSISPSLDGHVIVGGKNGIIREYYKDSSNQWQFHDIGSPEHGGNIESISALPDGSLMIGSSGSIIREAHKSPFTVTSLKQHLGQIIAKNNLNLSHGDQYGW